MRCGFQLEARIGGVEKILPECRGIVALFSWKRGTLGKRIWYSQRPLTLTAFGVPEGEGKEDVALSSAFNLD
jgi:hypothetical protein